MAPKSTVKTDDPNKNAARAEEKKAWKRLTYAVQGAPEDRALDHADAFECKLDAARRKFA
jgi:hypothetical protein